MKIEPPVQLYHWKGVKPCPLYVLKNYVIDEIRWHESGKGYSIGYDARIDIRYSNIWRHPMLLIFSDRDERRTRVGFHWLGMAGTYYIRHFYTVWHRLENFVRLEIQLQAHWTSWDWYVRHGPDSSRFALFEVRINGYPAWMGGSSAVGVREFPRSST